MAEQELGNLSEIQKETDVVGQEPDEAGFRFIDLFAGIGGIELGMRDAGLGTSLLCEIDVQAQAVLRHQFPGTRLVSDVRSSTEIVRSRCGRERQRGHVETESAWTCSRAQVQWSTVHGPVIEGDLVSH